MRAVITGENEERVGINIRDNNDAEYVIEMEFDGEIKFFEGEEYADNPRNRTNEENEHVNQAARYAKYYVYRERGYDTLTPYKNPDRIATLALVVHAMRTATFEEYFGDLYRQIRSHHTGEQPPRSLPEEISQEDVLFYRQNVYLGLDEDDVGQLAALFDRDAFRSFFDRAKQMAKDETETASDELEALAQELGDEVAADALPDDLWIDAVSDIQVRWDERFQQRIDTGDDPRDGDPDVRLELFPHAYEPDTIEAFQRHLLYHLKCHIRDCYVGMGLVPPEPVQITGPGIYTYSNWYQHHDVYQPYHDPDADINWSIQGPLPQQ